MEAPSWIAQADWASALEDALRVSRAILGDEAPVATVAESALVDAAMSTKGRPETTFASLATSICARRSIDLLPNDRIIKILMAAKRVSLRILRSESDAEDTAQDAFEDALKGLDRFSGDGAFDHFVAAIARNRALDRYRKKSRSRKALSRLGTIVRDGLIAAAPASTVSPLDTPEGTLVANEAQNAFHACFALLTERQKQMWRFKNLADKSYWEISRTLDIEMGTVGATLHQIAKRLAKCLAEKGVLLGGRS